MIRLKGTITAVGPIAVSYVDMDTKLPRTPHGEVMLYGGTFRGPLRKAAYKALRQGLARKKGVDERDVFTIEDAYMLGEGVDTTRGIENESRDPLDPLAEEELRRLNPMLNLFGRWRLPARLAVDGMRAPEDTIMVVGRGVRHDLFQRDNTEVAFLSEEQAQRLISMFASARNTQSEIDEIQNDVKRLKREITRIENREERAALSEQITDKEKQIKALKESREGAEESILHPISGFEAIAPGTELSHRMTLTDGKQTDLGLLLHALSVMGREPYLGGHRSIGCGQFRAQWTVSEWPVGTLQAEEIGRVSFDDDGFHLEGERLKEAADAFSDSMGAFDFTVATLAEARKRLDAKGA